MASPSNTQSAASTSRSKAKAGSSASAAKFNRISRFRDLELRMNEARKMNHAEVVAEDERVKRPQNFEAKRKRLEWEEEEDKKRKQHASLGENYDRVKLLDVGADEAERWERKKRKKNPDVGFADYEQATYRQYSQLSKQIKPDALEVSRQKEQLGDGFYASADTLGLHQRKDSEDAINRMVGDLEKQIEKRSKYSRRRTFDEEADVDYINERNAKFNQKLERFYGKYTAEIKQNLERGTAV